MEHLLQKSKWSIFHNIFWYMIFQRRQKVLLWSKGLEFSSSLLPDAWAQYIVAPGKISKLYIDVNE